MTRILIKLLLDIRGALRKIWERLELWPKRKRKRLPRWLKGKEILAQLQIVLTNQESVMALADEAAFYVTTHITAIESQLNEIESELKPGNEPVYLTFKLGTPTNI